MCLDEQLIPLAQFPASPPKLAPMDGVTKPSASAGVAMSIPTYTNRAIESRLMVTRFSSHVDRTCRCHCVDSHLLPHVSTGRAVHTFHHETLGWHGEQGTEVPYHL